MSNMSKRRQVGKRFRLEKKDQVERTILCLRCEALIVITTNKLIKPELSSTKGDTIMLKEPHLIRKVTY